MRVATAVRVVSEHSELSEKLPGFGGDPACRGSAGRRGVITNEDARTHRIARCAAGKVGANRVLSAGVRRRTQRCCEARCGEAWVRVRALIHARVVLQLRNAVCGISTRTILGSMSHKIRNWLAVGLVAAAHRSTRVDGDSADDIAHRASDGIGHGSTHTEAFGKDSRGIDAQLTLKLSDQRFRECYV